MKSVYVFILLSLVASSLMSATFAASLNSYEVTGARREVIADDETSFNLFGRLFEVSPETLETQELSKRQLQSCTTDADCPSTRYCSSKSFKCHRKLRLQSTCCRGAACANPRDSLCRSGYCGRSSHRCATRKGPGSKCKSNSACSTGYCSPRSGKCRTQKNIGATCIANQGCKSGYCVKGQCSGTPTTTSPPVTSPTGSGVPSR